jgi:hypothetical protein
MEKTFEQALNDLIGQYSADTSKADIISGLELALAAQKESAAEDESEGEDA